MAESDFIPGQVAPLDIEGAKALNGESIGVGIYNLWVGLNNEIRDRRHAIAGVINFTSILNDTHTNRPSPSGLTGGTLFFEADRNVVYLTIGGVWVYGWGEMAGDFGDEPTDLGATDAGFLFHVVDYAHRLRWTGSAWVFTDGGNGFFQDFAVAPGVGWELCDGSATDRLVVGASLSVAAITPPNLAGSPAYRKSGAAYTGSILGASGATGGGSGETGGMVGIADSVGVAAGGDVSLHFQAQSPQMLDHTHGAGSHTHSVGSLDMARLVVLPYFRR